MSRNSRLRVLKKLAIIGASYLQVPLIKKAISMGIQTHVFAWQVGDEGEIIADYFYPISIIEKEEILIKCREIGVDGICSIASDLAAVTVNYVANEMNLVGNSSFCMKASTNKYLMRNAFKQNNDPIPNYVLISDIADISQIDINYPAIVKPIDRSGSRGITKVYSKCELENAVTQAMNQGFEKKVLVEEYVGGQEYSVEYISYRGKHIFLAVTKKFTTGSPHFIETGHIEPAPINENLVEKIKMVVEHALDSLEIKNGASHSEIKISESGEINIIEIGGRMGGDFIGSDLVELSTGVDFVKAVIDVSLGEKPEIPKEMRNMSAGVRFIFNRHDLAQLTELESGCPDMICRYSVDEDLDSVITDSSNRHGYFIFQASEYNNLACFFEDISQGDIE